MTATSVRSRVVVAILLAAAATAACGGSDQQASKGSPGVAAAPTFAQADVDFVVQLSQHHSQALHLAELAASRGRSPAVKAIAADIAAAYAPQIDTLADWLRAWAAAGAELPAHGTGHDETGPGMVPDRAIVRLESLTGLAFDRQFRVLMARHHRGGLDLVAAQLQNGTNPDARALAERLRAEQTDQLADLS